jgi:maleate isomerase
MKGGSYDYGRAGIVGLCTPQANPTVEAEMAILLPPSVACATVRLTSPIANPLMRLATYLESIEEYLARFDALRPDVLGFGCTASSYLVNDEAKIVAAAELRFGYPIVTATAAIAEQLTRLRARRIALITPYPPTLSHAAARFWTQSGFDVVETFRVETGSADTRSIYALGSADARAALCQLKDASVDAILLSGTGMPTLPVLASPPPGPPLLSSNYCLAASLCKRLGLDGEPDFERWSARCAAATAPHANQRGKF